MAKPDLEVALTIPDVMLPEIFGHCDNQTVARLGLGSKRYCQQAIAELAQRKSFLQKEIEQSKIVFFKDHPFLLLKDSLTISKNNDAIEYILPYKNKQIINKDKIIETMTESHHSIYIVTKNGQLWVCGQNDKGQLGLGHKEYVPKLTPVKQLENEQIQKVISNGNSAYILTKAGKVFVCGANASGELGLKSKRGVTQFQLVEDLKDFIVKDIFIFSKSIYVLTDKGKIMVCGSNERGQLGVGHKSSISKFEELHYLNKLIIEKVFSNDYSTYLITNEGKLLVCGANGSGQLNLGHCRNISVFEECRGFNSFDIEQIEISQQSAKPSVWVLTKQGALIVFGENNYGQSGVGHKNPIKHFQQCSSLNGYIVKKIFQSDFSGQETFWVVTDKGKLLTSGANSYMGQENSSGNHITFNIHEGLQNQNVREFITDNYCAYILNDNGQFLACSSWPYNQKVYYKNFTIIPQQPPLSIQLQNINCYLKNLTSTPTASVPGKMIELKQENIQQSTNITTPFHQTNSEKRERENDNQALPSSKEKKYNHSNENQPI